MEKEPKRLVFTDESLVDLWETTKAARETSNPSFYANETDEQMLRSLLNTNLGLAKGQIVQVVLPTERIRHAWNVVVESYGDFLRPEHIMSVMIQRRYHELNSMSSDQAALLRAEQSMDVVISLISAFAADMFGIGSDNFESLKKSLYRHFSVKFE